MSTSNKMPEFVLKFRGLGASAIRRGQRGTAALILLDSTAGESIAKYKSIGDFTSEEQAKYTNENVLAIKDALEGTPLELYVFKSPVEGEVTDIFKTVSGKIPRNSWIGIQSGTQSHQDDLISFIKSENKNNKKRFKVFTYKATNPDDMHIVNMTNETVEFPDSRGTKAGHEAIAYMLGYYAGLPLSMSGIAKELKFKSVCEPENLDTAISNGEHVLFNDEGKVKIARAVNSLKTTGQDITEEMTFINTVEKMDFIYTDIFTTWNESYKGRYPNILNNQMLFIGAINGYYKSLARDYILDPNFENRSMIDIEAQRVANYPKYGEDVANGWDDNKVMQMTVSTKVFLKGNIKIAGIMEDFIFDIFM